MLNVANQSLNLDSFIYVWIFSGYYHFIYLPKKESHNFLFFH